MRMSKSRLMSFVACPEKYCLAYELDLKPRRKPQDLLVGASTHHLIATHFIRSHTEEFCDLREILQDYWSSYNLANTDFATLEDLEAGMDQSLELARVFLKEVSLEPLEVEYKFALPVLNIETGETLPDLELVGIIDIIDQPNGQRRAIEIKTKSRKPDEFGAQTSLELTCYAYWLRFLDDQEVIPASYVNIVKTKKPYIQWQNQERTTGDFVDLFHTIEMVAANILDRRFYRNPGVHCNWCDFRPFCTRDREAVKAVFGTEALEVLAENGREGI